MLEHEVKGRRWLCVGRESYTRKDGTTTTLLMWQIGCQACGGLGLLHGRGRSIG